MIGAHAEAGIESARMIDGKKLVVVLPAYNAAGTLELTFNSIPRGLVDEVILVDERSDDDTVAVAARLGISNVHVHESNRGQLRNTIEAAYPWHCLG